MSVTAQSAPAQSTHLDAVARKRLFAYRAFLSLAMFNNGLLAVYCLGYGGGAAFPGAPAAAVTALGVLGVITVVCSVAALAWKTWGLIGITLAGIAATGVAGAVQAFPAMAMFIVGTAMLLLIARHQWSRLG
jgi:hypothetical protein